MALPTPYFVTFEFSNQRSFFSVGATKTLALIHADCNIVSETEPGQASSGRLFEIGEIRREVELAFWEFLREPQPAYPDGQDVNDWWELTVLWKRFRFRRIAACNGVDFVNYPDRFPLPMNVEKDFDMKTTMKSNKLAKEITGNFLESTRYVAQ